MSRKMILGNKIVKNKVRNKVVYTVMINGKPRWNFPEEKYGKYAEELAELSINKGKKIINGIEEINGETYLLFFSKVTGITRIKIDKEDVDRILEHSWCLVTNKKGEVKSYKNTDSSLSLSRYIMKIDKIAEDKRIVDVINRDIYNLTKSNLRIVSRSEDGLNKKIDKRNKSGITGIFNNKQGNYYIGRLNYNSKTYSKVACYKKVRTEEEALRIVTEWRNDLIKKFNLDINNINDNK